MNVECDSGACRTIETNDFMHEDARQGITGQRQGDGFDFSLFSLVVLGSTKPGLWTSGGSFCNIQVLTSGRFVPFSTGFPSFRPFCKQPFSLTQLLVELAPPVFPRLPQLLVGASTPGSESGGRGAGAPHLRAPAEHPPAAGGGKGGRGGR